MNSNTSLHTIIFVSSVTEIISTEEVAIIVDNERKQSNANDLSGIAMVLGGNVLRMIEGPHKNVMEEYEKAKRNPNLTSIIKLLDSPSAHRYFETYVFMSDIHASINDYTGEDMENYLEECFSLDTKEMRILKDFIKNNK